MNRKPLFPILVALCFTPFQMITEGVSPTADLHWLDRERVLHKEAPDGAIDADGHLIVRRGQAVQPFLKFPFAVAVGDVISIELELEATDGGTDGDTGQAGLVLSVMPSQMRSTYNPDVDIRQIVLVGSEQERYRFAYVSQRAFAAGESGLLIAISYFQRPVLIRSIAITNHGSEADPDELTAGLISYAGQEEDAEWRRIAHERIRQHRMADLKVIVTDREGNPLPGATVQVEQLEHGYAFGTAGIATRMIDADRTFNPERFPDQEAARKQYLIDNVKYRKALLENFNTVVYENDLKWPQWSRTEGMGFRDQLWTLDSMDWLKDNGITIKGHTMVWGSWRFTPSWLRDLEDTPERVQEAVLTHIRDIGGATRDYAKWWDVVNEPMSHRNVIELLGMDAVAEWFKEARAVMPNTRLVINEFDIVGNGGSVPRREGFVAFCQDLIARGAPIDVIGFQGHFWSDRLTAPEDIWRIIDIVHAQLQRPLMISEFDMNLPNEAL